jgi:hypothetical protein
MEHVFKDDEMIIRPKVRPHPDFEQQEEVKGERELVTEVVDETRGFEADQNAYDEACEQDEKDLQDL